MSDLKPVPTVTVVSHTGTKFSCEPASRYYDADQVDALLSAIGAGGVQPLAGAAQQQVKVLDDPRLQELFMSAICGAMAFGYQDTSPPPPGHWLQQAWDIGRAEAKRLEAAQACLSREDIGARLSPEVEANARRWLAVRSRHAMALCRIATGSSSYSSIKAPALLDAWGDMAAAQLEAFDAEHFASVEVPERIADLERSVSLKGGAA